MRSKWLISVGLVVCLVATFALPACVPKAAPPVEEEKPPVEEEKPPVEEEEELAKSIVAYMSASPDRNVAICNFIKENLGVEVVQTFMSCGETDAKLKAEAPRFSADFCCSVCNYNAFTAKKEGWTVPYVSPNWQGAGEVWVDTDNEWFKLGVTPIAFLGNGPMLDEAGYEMPKNWDDLLDPKWKGEIVIPSAVHSGNGFKVLYGAIQIYGLNKGLTGEEAEEAGWEYLKELDKNIHHYTRSGSAPADLVGRGEFMLGIAQDAALASRLEKGYPLVWDVPEEGVSYGGSFAFILKGAKEEYTAKKIIDFLGTSDFSDFYLGVGYVTKNPALSHPLYGTGLPKFIPGIDEVWFCDNKSRLVDEWKDRFLLKVEEE